MVDWLVGPSLLSLEFLGDFSFGAFLVQVAWKKLAVKEKIDFVSVINLALLSGCVLFGIFEYAVRPSPTTDFAIISSWAPHAYNLIIWPLAAYLILGPRFGSRLLVPCLMFTYGLDEIIWNCLAYLRYYGQPSVIWFIMGPVLGSFWWMFFFVIIAITIIGAIIIRPRFRFSLYIPLFVFYLVLYGWGASMPTRTDTPLGLTFELLWQIVIWALYYFTLFPRKKI